MKKSLGIRQLSRAVGKLDWRQNFLALAIISKDSKASYEGLMEME
jgi:hypothetical protein